MPGLYSLQCVSKTSGAPDVTVYREDLDSLVGPAKTSQLSMMKAQKRFSFFVLRHAVDRCDVYDKKGAIIRDAAGHPESYSTAMSPTPIVCNNAQLAAQSTWLLAVPTVCASFEAHGGQSAAARSNFYTMLDQLLNMAKSDKDREHIYVLSHHSPCPRSVLVADLSKTSEHGQEIFLDYFRRLKNGWPLSPPHHKTELARTLSSCRYEELRRWLHEVRMKTVAGEDPRRLSLILSAIPLRVRFALARAFVDVIYPQVFLPEEGAEQISDEDVYARTEEIGAALDQVMRTPMSNS